jgi:hypothetical protein
MTTSLRKRYPTRVESPDRDEPPIASIPAAAVAESPPPAASDVPKENIPSPDSNDKMPSNDGAANASPMLESDPVREAEQNAIKARLREMETAEHLQHEAASQRQQRSAIEELQRQPGTAEQIIQSSGLPESAKAWLRQHPEYVTDPVKNAHVQKMHVVAEYQAGEAFSPAYYARMDALLGFKRENGNGAQQPSAPTAPRNVAPARRPMAAPVLAPPTREVPSMTTGRAPRPTQLTAAQREAARFSGISEEEYARQEEKRRRMQEAGQLDDRR